MIWYNSGAFKTALNLTFGKIKLAYVCMLAVLSSLPLVGRYRSSDRTLRQAKQSFLELWSSCTASILNILFRFVVNLKTDLSPASEIARSLT